MDHIKETLSGHPKDSEYLRTVNTQIFHDYVEELPSSQFTDAQQIMESGSQEDIVGLVKIYEEQEYYKKSKRSMILKMIQIHNDPYYMPLRISYAKGGPL